MPSKIFAIVEASIFMCFPASETPFRLKITAIGETYTGTSKAVVPFVQTDFDFSNSSSLSDLSDPAQAVAPVINVVTPAPEPVGL